MCALSWKYFQKQILDLTSGVKATFCALAKQASNAVRWWYAKYD